MPFNLNPEIAALCERAAHEQNTEKLLELTKKINDLLEKQQTTYSADRSQDQTKER